MYPNAECLGFGRDAHRGAYARIVLVTVLLLGMNLACNSDSEPSKPEEQPLQNQTSESSETPAQSVPANEPDAQAPQPQQPAESSPTTDAGVPSGDDTASSAAETSHAPPPAEATAAERADGNQPEGTPDGEYAPPGVDGAETGETPGPADEAAPEDMPAPPSGGSGGASPAGPGGSGQQGAANPPLGTVLGDEGGDALPDLVVLSVDASGVTTDPQSLQATGTVLVTIMNVGHADAMGPFEVTLFEDRNFNGRLEPRADNLLGVATVPVLTVGAATMVPIEVVSTVLFRDNLVFAHADSDGEISEDNETNNYAAANPKCAGGSLAGRTYTSDADFAEGVLTNINYNFDDELRLNPTITTPFPFIWVACSGRGTIVRIDVNSGAVLGEYYSAPNGRGRDPSRTTVDFNGNVWVGNRGESGSGQGSVTRVGMVIGGTRGNKAPDGTFTPDPNG